jgi:hypothetical protein
MGIKLVTLALAAERGLEIPIHQEDGERVKVRILKFDDGFPVYAFVYKNGVIRKAQWIENQAVPGEILEECLL